MHHRTCPTPPPPLRTLPTQPDSPTPSEYTLDASPRLERTYSIDMSYDSDWLQAGVVAEKERREVNIHASQHRYLERERLHEQTHASQPTPFPTYSTSHAHTTYEPTPAHMSQDISFEDKLLLPMLPDGRLKLPSSQNSNIITLSYTRRGNLHQVTTTAGRVKE